MNTDSIRVYQCPSVVKPFFYESSVVFGKQIPPMVLCPHKPFWWFRNNLKDMAVVLL